MKTKNHCFRLFAPLVLLITFSISSYGQNDDEATFSGGAKVLSNMTLSDGTSTAFGYGAGAFADLNFLSFMTVRGEILYVSHAARLASYQQSLGSLGSVDYYNRNLRFHTVEIPILAQFRLPVMESLKPKLYIGGSYSYNFSVYEINNRTYNFVNPDSHIDYNSYGNDVSSYFQSYNASGIAGISVAFESIIVDVRYQQGIPNLIKNNSLALLPYPQTYQSRLLTLSVSYKLF